MHQFDISNTDLQCDTTTTPFSVKDILNINAINDNEYFGNSVKKEHNGDNFNMQQTYWENSGYFGSLEQYGYYFNSDNENFVNRNYWNCEHGEGTHQNHIQHLNNLYCANQSEQVHRGTKNEAGYIKVESPSKSVNLSKDMYNCPNV